MRSGVQRGALILILASLAGCGCVRASGGLGLGLGASARVGVLDVGATIGGSYEWGTAYGVHGGQTSAELGFPLLGRLEVLRLDAEGLDRERSEGVIPALLKLSEPESSRSTWRINRPTELGLCVRALFVSFHLGFDPAVLVRAILGMEEPAPPLLPETERDARSGDGIVAFDDAGPEAIDALGDDPTALVRLRGGRVSVAAAPEIALVLSVQDGSRAWAAVAHRQALRGAAAFEAGFRLHDIEWLERALADCPLAPQAPRAARLLAELRFEKGELARAAEAFELEAALVPVAERGEPTRLAALARAALARTGHADAFEEKLSFVELGPYHLVTDDLGVSAVTGTNEVAWVQTNTLGPPGTPAGGPPPGGMSLHPRLLGVAHGLALVAIPREDPSALLALDERGEVRWRTELPRTRVYGSPTSTLLANGRVFVVRRNRALAVDALTGRMEWAFARHERTIAGTIPAGCGPVVARELEGPRVRVTPTALEWRTDLFPRRHAAEAERTERLSVRTGLPLGPETARPEPSRDPR